MYEPLISFFFLKKSERERDLKQQSFKGKYFDFLKLK